MRNKGFYDTINKERGISRGFDDNIECIELILRIILDKLDIKADRMHTQREIKNL